MFCYIPVQETLYTPELGRYQSYGICVLNDKGERVAFVSDVSTDPKEVATIVARCIVEQLDPEQLLDVISDSL